MKKLLVLVALLVATVAAHAASVNILFNGFQPGGWQVGYPYYASINGGPSIPVMCDDWMHGGLHGDTWQANYTNLGAGNTSLLRFNQMPNTLTLYQEAGWLLLETQQNFPQATDINYAVWQIFDSTAPSFGNSPYWLNQAQLEARLAFRESTSTRSSYLRQSTSMTPTQKALRSYRPSCRSRVRCCYSHPDWRACLLVESFGRPRRAPAKITAIQVHFCVPAAATRT
jgi:hypothetical protein